MKLFDYRQIGHKITIRIPGGGGGKNILSSAG